MMEDFAKYNSNLENIFHLWIDTSSTPYTNKSSNVAEQIRSLVSIDALKESGVFFTGDNLADKAIRELAAPFTEGSYIIDPTCGSGNLLIAATKLLHVLPTASETLKTWGGKLCGIDIFPEFVYCTKLRIILEVLIRGATLDEPLEKLLSYLPNIFQGNCLDFTTEISKATHIVMNPPFNASDSVVDYEWAKGKISNAAVYYYEIVKSANDGCCVSAILPDVLRSGSRFKNWRDSASNLSDGKISIEGRFDNLTDIDIFILSGIKSSATDNTIPWQRKSECLQTSQLGEFFNISVGTVVPYRDPHEGELCSYIHPKILPKWEEYEKPQEFRYYSGKTHTPPFVVIRRTSGPRDKCRAVPTLILGTAPIAVENHLIVLKPKSGGLKNCRELMKALEKEYVNEFLNERIRCRHLTVTAVSEIPWSKS
jgi:hypothetical protein